MENWRDELDLPDELKTSEVLAQYESVGDALQGFVQTKSMVGRSIVVPGEDAGEDAWNDYYAKLQKTAPNLTIHPEHANDDQAKEFWRMAGVPEEATGYKAPEDFGDKLNADYVENLRGIAAEAGWTNKQFQKTLGALATQFEAEQTSFQEMKAADNAIVTGKFGAATEQKKENIKALAEQFSDPDHPPAWLQNMDSLTAADIFMLDNIVKSFTGKGPQTFQQPKQNDGLTPDEIRQQQAEIRDRLIKEQYTMPRTEYVRLQKKLVTLGEMMVPQ